MSEKWPCSTCGKPGVKNLLTDGYCIDHLIELFSKFAFVDVGCGVDTGGGRLQCYVCGATWYGDEGETCGWCWRRDERMREEHVTMVTKIPDNLSKESVKAWKDRMQIQVDAGNITEEEMENAIRRALVKARSRRDD